MSLSLFLNVVARRWYILIIGLLATVGIGYAAAIAVPPTYTAKGLVLLLPSAETVGDGGNPLLSLGGLEQPASLVVAQLNSTEANAQVAAIAPTAEYRVAMDDSTRGPVVALEVTDPNPRVALETQRYLASEIVSALDSLQRQVEAPPKSMLSSMPLVMDQDAEMSTTRTLRTVIAAVVAGLALTMLATFALDGAVRHRRETAVQLKRRRDDPNNPSSSATDAARRFAPDTDRQGSSTATPPTPTVTTQSHAG